MAPRKPKPKVAPEVPFAPAKVSKRKTRATAEATVIPSASSAKQPAPRRIKKYRNGLLNLEKTPPDLVAIVERNATESPLLRLPPEIRNKIWLYALSYELVRLPVKKPDKGGAVRFTNDRRVPPKTSWLSGEQQRAMTKVPSAFHLPETSRQIYSETRLSAYSHSTFTFGGEFVNSRNGITGLKAVQRRAITSIELSPLALYDHCMETRDEPGFVRPLKSRYFQNLGTIVVSRLAFEYVKHWGIHDPHPLQGMNQFPRSQAQWKVFITQEIRNKEGEDIKVVFKDPDPSW